ncbi:MAG: NAD-dependent epimerase/dehydratase family protein [Candidatus Bathyarchaeia archaeon]
MVTKMATMVTGGTGFVSSRLVRKLVEQGEDVVVFDISPNFKFIADIIDKTEFVQGDITNLSEVIDAIKVHDVEYIYHAAALLHGVCRVVPVRAVNVNGVGMANVLEASRLMDVKKIVFTSTIAVFGDFPGEIYDDSPKYPMSPYGALKLLGELYGLWYHRTYGLDFRGVRFPLVYGAGDPYAYHTVSRIIENPALGKPVEFPFPSDRIGTWLYVKDAVDALMLVLGAEEKKVKKRVYNVEGVSCSFQELADIVRKFVPDAVIKFAPKEEGPPSGRLFHGTCLKEELGWRPSYTMEEGVKETIDEVRGSPHLYSKGYYVKDRYV